MPDRYKLQRVYIGNDSNYVAKYTLHIYSFEGVTYLSNCSPILAMLMRRVLTLKVKNN